MSNLSVRGRLRLGPHLQSNKEAILGIPEAGILSLKDPESWSLLFLIFFFIYANLDVFLLIPLVQPT